MQERVNDWPWMLFKVAGGTILCQAGPAGSDGRFPITHLTELKVVDPRRPIFEKAASDIADVWTKRLMSDNEKRKHEATK